jgi:uncharacterized protein YggU (UPF0235/DUF167 family)
MPGVAKSQIELMRGQTSKRKQLKIKANAAIAAKWQNLLENSANKH